MAEKIHPPSARKLSQARTDGRVWRANLLIQAIGIIVFIIAANFFKTMVLEALYILIQLQAGEVLDLRHALGMAAAVSVGFVVATLGLVSVVCSLASCGFGGLVFSAKPIALQVERLDPVGGFKRLAEGVREGWQLCARLVCALLITIWLWSVELPIADPVGLLSKVLWVCFAIFFVLSLADAALRRRKFFADLRMTEEELRREGRETEGDPLLKAMQRSMRDSLSRGEMVKRLRRAAVLVVRRSKSNKEE